MLEDWLYMSFDVYDYEGNFLGKIRERLFMESDWMDGFITFDPEGGRIDIHHSNNQLSKPNGSSASMLHYLQQLEIDYARLTIVPMIKKPKAMLGKSKPKAVVSNNRKTRRNHTTNEDSLNTLLSKAHLFVFDDDAFDIASDCDIPLSKLPYPVCITEDVLLYETNGAISCRQVIDGADEGLALKLMSFVVSSCVASKSSEDARVYHISLDALQSDIETHRVQMGIRKKGHGTGKGTGRKPRSHPRRGHWRNQPYGPKWSLRKKIWISDTIITPSGKPYKVSDVSRIHRVSLVNDA